MGAPFTASSRSLSRDASPFQISAHFSATNWARNARVGMFQFRIDGPVLTWA